MTGIKTEFSAKSNHTRISWTFEVMKYGDSEYEVHVFKKSYGGSIELFCCGGPKSEKKMPLGHLIDFKLVNQKNKKDVPTDYMRVFNEDRLKVMFEMKLLNVFLLKTNEFTQKCAEIISTKGPNLLFNYLTLMVHSKEFRSHRENIHTHTGFQKDEAGIQKQDLEEKGGTVTEYIELLNMAKKNYATANKDPTPRKRLMTDFVKVGPPKKRFTLQERKNNDFGQELKDEAGIEKAFVSSYLGRASIRIDKLDISPIVGLPIDKQRVAGIKEAMLTRFDPSLAVLTVSPADETPFDVQNVEDRKFIVSSGRHKFLAMQQIHEDGQLSQLVGIENSSIPCIIINAKTATGQNYANIRSNDLGSKFHNPPTPESLIHVLVCLKKAYQNSEKALSDVERFSKLMMMSSDHNTVLRKLSKWPTESLDMLTKVLNKYSAYGTLDVQESSAGGNKMKLQMGVKLKLPRPMFIGIGKSTPEILLQFGPMVLDNKMSLKSLLSKAQKQLDIQKAEASLLKVSSYKSREELNIEYPGKFTEKVLEQFSGADSSKGQKNVQGQLLENYYKSVVETNGTCDNEMKIETFDAVWDVDEEKISGFDAMIFNWKTPSTDYIEKALSMMATLKQNKFIAMFLPPNGKIQLQLLLKMKMFVEEKSGEFEIRQVFFDKDQAVKEGSENVDFAIILGKNVLAGEYPKKVLYDNVNVNLSKVLNEICPLNGKLVVVNIGDAKLPDIDMANNKKWSQVKFFCSKEYENKIEKKLIKNKVKPDEKVDVYSFGDS